MVFLICISPPRVFVIAATVLLATLCQLSGCVDHAKCTQTSPGVQPKFSPTTQGNWIRPSAADARPIWGIPGGISVGLWPTAGPRGLIRIFTPYLNQRPGRIMQFIAVEPVVDGKRDLSEMQKSRSDDRAGKMMWTTDTIELARLPADSSQVAAGIVTSHQGFETLSFWVNVERFDNGAKPMIEITLRSDRPHEVIFQTYAAADSAPMQSCVLTATMGNFARLRHLHLQNRIVNSTDLYQHALRDSWNFFPWQTFTDLSTTDGSVTVAATGDIETNPPKPPGWRYEGMPATQYWRTAPCAGLTARVNGRTTFWGTNVAIPGGAAYENFELMSPFVSGQAFCFGIDPVSRAN